MIKRAATLLTLYGIATLLLIACNSAPVQSGTASNQVHMNDINFVQSSITIKKGEHITLVADTLTPHTIANGTWENGTSRATKEPGAPTVDNLSVAGNSSATIGPFNSAGTFQLYCTIHVRMNLTVIVQ
ncbi:hypothetical protein KSC_033400 [Ktedonobacter sp. SOSP1-52]|uniref:cupredoxin domain-containing protein n=1 Tax=Ktedonobacter sp. SOSP1-52 TaxID=2778366 RepID=UPI0019152C49|nr:plastocyanin/azurin family copper-binding protein [Ktedonobacter sp. SOSP1-52]GHO64448.1 hypothetical protein KSC_033400 [Ktedonobacter sp. SOSP1-52]